MAQADPITLVEACTIIKKALTCRGLYSHNKSIQANLWLLCEKYGFSRDDLLAMLVIDFAERHCLENFDPVKRASQPVYVTRKVDWLLKDLKRHRKKAEPDPLDLKDPVPESFLEKLDVEGIVDPTTPEDLLIEKELREEMFRFFGPEDAEVILGRRDRRTEADRRDIAYDAYCKRLYRKTLAFHSHLLKNHYL